MSSKDDHIATFFILYLQNLFNGMAQGNEDFGYQFNTWMANLTLCFYTKFLESFLDFLTVLSPFLTFSTFHHPFNHGSCVR